MTLKPVDQILQQLMSRSAWAHQRRLQTIITTWQKILPSKTRQNSRPYGIQENILLIATKNSTWSQQLKLQRLRILQQLNQQLTEPLTDLRCSSTYWQQSPAYSPLADPELPHPSRTPQSPTPQANQSDTPTAAVLAWFDQKQARLQQSQPCPQCGALTPQGELDRWQQCSCCIAQKWHLSKEIFPDTPST